VQLRFDDDADRDDPVVRSFVARIPKVRPLHEALRLTDEESWATLGDLPRHARLDRICHGSPGLRDTAWIELVWSGRLAELGRLQFEDLGDGVLSVHIPESGPLDAEACDASFARAREIYPDHRTARCHSWLLDPALAEVLPAHSNIVRFQRRFVLETEGEHANGDVLRFVFHTYDPDIDKIEPRTTLERALLARMRAGEQWRAPLGVTSLA
jgi:GNAT domain-containint protein/N-acyltransferase family protein